MCGFRGQSSDFGEGLKQNLELALCSVALSLLGFSPHSSATVVVPNSNLWFFRTEKVDFGMKF